MDIRKFSKLHDLIINEEVEQARELFHEIVVEKSREIFESIMEDDMEDDMDYNMEGMGGQVGDLRDEIDAEESGDMGDEDEDEDDIDFDDDAEEAGADFTHDMEMDHDEEDDDSEIEDAVIRIEDKLDQLMAEFEEIMSGDEDMGDEDMGDEDMGDEDMGDEDEESMMEAVQLKKVSVTHGDNGAYTRSPNTNNSGQAGMDSRPVKFSGASESVPNSPKGPSNFYSKGETSVKGAGNFKNSPGKDNFRDKGEAAPKPKHGDDGAHTRSPVAESRRPVRRPIR